MPLLSNFEAELVDVHKELEAEMKNGVAYKNRVGCSFDPFNIVLILDFPAQEVYVVFFWEPTEYISILMVSA